jgi:hypothetical protein
LRIQVAAQLGKDVRGILVRDEVEVDLRARLGGNDGVARLDVACGDRRDVRRGAEDQAPAELRLRQPWRVPGAPAGAEVAARRDDPLRGRDRSVVPRGHVVVEACDQDVAGCVGQGRKSLCQERRGGLQDR